MQFNLDNPTSRLGTGCLKWEWYEYFMPDAPKGLTPFWVADMDLPTSPAIAEAMRNRTDHHLFGYTMPYDKEYFSSIIGWYQKRFGWSIEPKQISYSPNVVTSLHYLVRQLSKIGEGIIIQRPVYGPFTKVIENNRRRVVNNSLINTDGYYTIDFEDLEKKASLTDVSMMIFCSPHNPVGRVWTENELKKVVEICDRHNVILISDEIHSDLVRKENCHLPILKLFPNHHNIVSCLSIGKTFNMSGMHLSHVIIPNEAYRSKFLYERDELNGLPSPNLLVAEGMKAAYKKGEAWLDQINTLLDRNAKIIADYVAEHLPFVRFVRPEGTYIAWFDLRGTGYSHEEISNRLREKGKVLFGSGLKFGPEGEGFMRIIFACPLSTLMKALEGMKKAFVN